MSALDKKSFVYESVCIVTMLWWEDGESVDREEDTFDKAKVVVEIIAVAPLIH